MFAGADFHAVCGRGLWRHLLAQTLTAFLDVDFGDVRTRFSGFCGCGLWRCLCLLLFLLRNNQNDRSHRTDRNADFGIVRRCRLRRRSRSQTLVAFAGADFGAVRGRRLWRRLRSRTWQHLWAQTLMAFSDADFDSVRTRFGGVCTLFCCFCRRGFWRCLHLFPLFLETIKTLDVSPPPPPRKRPKRPK